MSTATPSAKALRANYADVTPQVHKLDAGRASTLGRSTECDVIVTRPFASRIHARIESEGHYCLLIDNQSANGTYVNGRLMKTPHRLKHGDEIGLGDPTGLLVYLDEEKTVQPLAQLQFDFRNWRFLWDGNEIVLTNDQLNLLLHLFEHRGEVCDRPSCARAIWGHDYDNYMDAGALDQIFSRLRAKLRATSEAAGALIMTMRGKGYMLKLG
jgi:DNA-binding response OmpR family regulator